MDPRDLCAGSSVIPYLTLFLSVFYLALVVVIVRESRRSGRPLRVRGMLIGLLAFAAPVVVLTLDQNRAFHAYEVAEGILSLRYHLPKPAVDLSSAAIDSFSVVRGRHYYRDRGSDRWHLRVQSGSSAYGSCEGDRTVVDEARAIAAKLQKPIAWRERCPDGRLVPSTEASVMAPGQMGVAPECPSSR